MQALRYSGPMNEKNAAPDLRICPCGRPCKSWTCMVVTPPDGSLYEAHTYSCGNRLVVTRSSRNGLTTFMWYAPNGDVLN